MAARPPILWPVSLHLRLQKYSPLLDPANFPSIRRLLRPHVAHRISTRGERRESAAHPLLQKRAFACVGAKNLFSQCSQMWATMRRRRPSQATEVISSGCFESSIAACTVTQVDLWSRYVLHMARTPGIEPGPAELETARPPWPRPCGGRKRARTPVLAHRTA